LPKIAETGRLAIDTAKHSAFSNQHSAPKRSLGIFRVVALRLAAPKGLSACEAVSLKLMSKEFPEAAFTCPTFSGSFDSALEMVMHETVFRRAPLKTTVATSFAGLWRHRILKCFSSSGCNRLLCILVLPITAMSRDDGDHGDP
jgi:hypothetical protein